MKKIVRIVIKHNQLEYKSFDFTISIAQSMSKRDAFRIKFLQISNSNNMTEMIAFLKSVPALEWHSHTTSSYCFV